MDEKRIGEIVRKVHQIANENCVSDAPSALAIHVEDEIFKLHKKKISSKTIERAFKRHILKDKTVSERNPESISLLCMYLGFDDYKDYIKKSPPTIGGDTDIGTEVIREPPKRPNWKLIITISVAFGAILTTIWIIKNQSITDVENESSTNKEETSNPSNPNVNMLLVDSNECMTWADSLYVVVSCDKAPLSKFGTQVKPLDLMELKNMKKVEVNAGYPFFTKDDKPLIWYCRNKDDEFEYFTAPGLHPVTGKTLRKITPYIIQTYVPMHQDKQESFLQH